MMLHNFSRHQEIILRVLAEEVKDELQGLPVTMLSRIAAKSLETEPGSHMENSINKKADVLTEKWRATFSRSLKRLEARGLIKRISHHTSGRTHRVCLTPEGRTIGERKVK